MEDHAVDKSAGLGGSVSGEAIRAPRPDGPVMTSFTKADLRNRGLKRRDEVDPEARARFAARLALVAPRLALEFSLPGGQPPVTALYTAIGSEPDTGPLASALRAQDVPLVLPVDWSHGGPLVYRRWKPGDPLASGPLGIGEPLHDAPDRDPEVLFVPLVAFDRRGIRIGYGAGNLDRTITRLRAQGAVRVIGVGYAVQEEVEIPNDPHDEPLDVVVTDQDVIFVGS